MMTLNLPICQLAYIIVSEAQIETWTLSQSSRQQLPIFLSLFHTHTHIHTLSLSQVITGRYLIPSADVGSDCHSAMIFTIPSLYSPTLLAHYATRHLPESPKK